MLYSTPALLAGLGAETGLQQPRVPARRHRARRPPTGRSRAARRYLKANTSFTGFSDLPAAPQARQLPGQGLLRPALVDHERLHGAGAAGSALVLIANTMTTLIGEQRREIGMMKAIGGTRRQIRRIYLRTALLLGAAGSVIGVVLGLVVANAVVRYFGSSFFAISPGFERRRRRSSSRASLVGLVAPPLAALPAIRRGSRIPVREGLEEVPALQGSQALLDRALRRLSLPAADGADRRPQRHPPRTAQRRHGRPDRARGRDAARGARADQQRHHDHERRLEPGALGRRAEHRRRHAVRRTSRPADPDDAGRRARAAGADER